MQTIKQLFGTAKPIIALLHFRELPGDPGYRVGQKLEELVACAREELHALQDGGVDGILFSNEFSFPYLDHLEHVTTATMAYIIGRLKEERTLSNLCNVGESCVNMKLGTYILFISHTNTLRPRWLSAAGTPLPSDCSKRRFRPLTITFR